LYGLRTVFKLMPAKLTMTKEFNVIIEKGRDGYLISEVIELPGCHTQAKNLDDLVKRTKEAISLYLECRSESDVEQKFVGLQKVAV